MEVARAGPLFVVFYGAKDVPIQLWTLAAYDDDDEATSLFDDDEATSLIMMW